YFARLDNQVCRAGADGAIELCCGPYATLSGGPILFGSTPVVATIAGSGTTAQRLFAVQDDGSGNCTPKTTLQIADFVHNIPTITPNNTIYNNTNQTIIATQFNNLTWASHITSKSPHYFNQPTFHSHNANQPIILNTTPTANIVSFP